MLFFEPLQNHVKMAYDQLEHIDLLVQQVEDMLLDRAFGRQIVNIDVVGLAQPVHPADPLLHSHRVPGQVEVDHLMAKLQVDTFAARFGRDHHLGPAAEQVHHPIFFASVHPTPVRNRGHSAVTEVLQQILLRSPILGEHDHLVIHFTDQLHRFLRLAVRFDLTDQVDKIPNPIADRGIRGKLLR
ncbi:hypothetical protein D3C81_1647000 [compost metagenome]